MKNKALKLQLFSFLFVFLTVLLFPRVYAERDDVGFVYLFENHYFAPFMHPALSSFFHLLYGITLLPWYSLYHYALLALTLGLVLNIITSLRLPLWLKWGIALFTCIVFTNFICRITFTYTAILLQGVSIFGFLSAIFHALKAQEQKTRPLLTSLAYGSLFALSYMTRTESIGAFLFILPPTLGLAWLISRQSGFKKLSFYAMLFLLPLALAVLANDFYLAGMKPDERLYVEETSAFANTIGFAYTKPVRALHIPEKIGWTLNDYQMFSKWLFLDERRFSMNHIKQMGHFTGAMLFQTTSEFLQPARFARVAYETLSKCWMNQGRISFYLLGILVISLSLFSSLRQRAALLLYACYCFMGSLLLYEYLRFPDRVSAPVYFIVALSVLVCLHLAKLAHTEKKLLHKTALIAGLGLLLASGAITLHKNRALAAKAQKPLETIRYLEALQPGSYICYILRTGDTISTQWLDPLKVNPLRLPDIGPGWLIFSPAFYNRLHQLGLHRGSEVLPWMIDNPKAYLVMKKKDKVIVEDFIQQTYHIQAQALPAGHLPSNPNSVVFRLVRKPAVR
jgi:hypothetical protein